MKKIIISIGVIVCLALILGMAIMTKDKNLEFESDEVKKLYSYLGEVDYYHCGGLSIYEIGNVTIDTIDIGNRLCLAYHNLDTKNLQTEELKASDKNEYKTPICKVGEELTFAADEETDKCVINEFSAEELDKEYQKMYGRSIKEDEYTEFYTNYSQICQKEGEKYYCGEAETYNVAILPDTQIYRLKKKAVKHYNGDIIIEDYFLRITDNKCYLANNLEEEDTECSKKLSEYTDFTNEKDDKKAEFIKQYGQVYRHTFKQSDDGSYYWFQTESNN